MRKFISLLFILILLTFSAVLAIKYYETSLLQQTLKEYQNLPLEKKIGQLIITGFKGKESSDINLKKTQEFIKKGLIGGVIFFNHNIKSKPQVIKLISSIKQIPVKIPLFIAIDQEGGAVQRLNKKNGFTNYLAPEAVALNNTPDKAYLFYKKLALELNNTGFNLNFAPVVDVNTNPNSPIIGKLKRSFSASANIVVQYATSFIKAHTQNNIIPVLKHFPGHGSANKDSHLGGVNITKTWRAEELLPFERLTKTAYPMMIMTAHVFNSKIDKIYPATLSEKYLKNILRKKINYQGVIISDDLYMQAIANNFSLKDTIIHALSAGNDILLFASSDKNNKATIEESHRIIKKALSQNQLTKQIINQSFNRVLLLKIKSGILPNRYYDFLTKKKHLTNWIKRLKTYLQS